MSDYRQKPNAAQPWRILLAVLCVVLVIVAGTVQVAHIHARGAATHGDCALCSAAHITVQVAYAPAAIAPIAVVTAIESVPALVLPSALSTFALFTRPPPAAISAA